MRSSAFKIVRNQLAWSLGIITITVLTAAADESPRLASNIPNLDRAFSIALSDVAGNIHPYQAGLLESPAPALMAGAGYDTPWTRDTAINTWNATGLLYPTIARNTILSVIERQNGKLSIAGQYWDAIILATGAWNYYLYTGDRDLLAQVFSATTNTLAVRESEEFDTGFGLFRGPAVYGDGIAAYPDRYSVTNATSGIVDWTTRNPALKAGRGYGLPMCTLSLNCTYFNTYKILPAMAKALGAPVDPTWEIKAAQLRVAINKQFWNPTLGRYITLVDPWGTDDRQETIGLAFSILFNVASPEQQSSVFRNTVSTPAGMPCLWPTFPRYSDLKGFGRHSGMVWPHAQAFWADAAARTGHADLFAQELTSLADKAVRDGQFYELYNPISGQPDGGLQEKGPLGIGTWDSVKHQTWSATGYLRLVLFDLAGMRFDEDGITFSPLLPCDIHHIRLTGLKYRNAVIDLDIEGSGNTIGKMTVNGKTSRQHRISKSASGPQQIVIVLRR